MEGHATPEATQQYAHLHPAAVGHYRLGLGLTVSSLGHGTYLGATHEAARHEYRQAILASLRGGVNVLDTAANYREQASERDVGDALRRFVDEGGRREQVLLCTKAGYLHGDVDESRAWFHSEYGDTVSDVDVQRSHSLQSSYVRHEVLRSARNLGVSCIDVQYLHNPEHQLAYMEPAEFYAAVEDAFAELERLVDEGRIRAYGVATWNGLRVDSTQRGHLSLVRLVHHAGQARMRIGGRAASHHFRAIQLPINHAMTEAVMPLQEYRFAKRSVLECASDLGLFVAASASLLQMRQRVPSRLRQAFQGSSDAEAALQFARSIPGVTCALVGASQKQHAAANATYACNHAPDAAAALRLLSEK